MGLVAPRSVVGTVVAVALLTFGGGTAHAVNYGFSVNPSAPNQDELTTFRLTPTAADVERVNWDLDGDGQFDDGTARTATRSYATGGPVTVRMRARATSESAFQTVSKTITVNGRPAADFGYAPSAPLAGEAVDFTPAVTDPEGDPVTLAWSFGDGQSSDTGAPTHSFDTAGEYDVVLTATDEHDAVTQVMHQVTVAADPGPAPAFEYTPSNPMPGDDITFTSTSTPSRGVITATEWDFDGDGGIDASGSEVHWTFDAAGVHRVTMRVTQANGKQAVAFADVQVGEDTPPPPPPPDDPPPAQQPSDQPPADQQQPGFSAPLPSPKVTKPPALMRPFPVVRIAGVVLPRGALLKVLSVRTARGSKIVVRCRGRGCPVGAVARSATVPLVRIHRFERRLPAGVRLELFIRKAGRIGKYTRVLIRAGKPPARLDRCLMPGRDRPVRCP